MSYTVQKLANISGVTVRTLHYYDEVGLLEPSRVKNNGYRFYEEKELLKLQQIMFFRELDFPIVEIKKIMDDPKFDTTAALRDHKKLIEIKKIRLEKLVQTIDKTIKRIQPLQASSGRMTKKETTMKDEELYQSFKEHDKKYAKEAKERWGNTEAYKQSQEKVKKMSKEDMFTMKKNGDELMKEIVANMNKGPESRDVQKLIDRHYNNLRTFYEPNIEMYRGLAQMYVDDPRFTAYFEKYAKGLAVFMRDAMYVYCQNHK